jgi:polysaccharide export outer membrane protein
MSTLLLVSMMALLGPVADSVRDHAANAGTASVDRSWAYRIGPEDLLQISVWNNEPLSRAVPVRPDGMITLPLLNDVQAAGLTPSELRTYLVKRLAEFLPSPEVSVIVTEVRSLKVSVVGSVSKPGRYDYKSWATVLDAIAMAGGFTEFASRSKILVLRSEGKSPQRLTFNYDKATSDGGEQANFFLRPGDVVVVR